MACRQVKFRSMKNKFYVFLLFPTLILNSLSANAERLFTLLGGSILADFPLTICGRSLIIDDVEMIRRIIASDPKATREWISREVCQAWSWFKPDGGLKNMSCNVLLLRLHRSGMITSPKPRRSNANGRKFSRRTKHGEAGKEISGPLKSLLPLELIRVTSKKDSYLWNEFIDRYHYLGYTPLPGAQIRYLINSPAGYLCAIGFSAAAWKVAQKGYLYRLER